jgi:glycosyltransferase involved in cell wall biosynthesis
MALRILYVITDSGIGGSEKVLLSLLEQKDPAAYLPCGVLVLKNRREMARKWEAQGVPVEFFGMNKIPSPLLIWKIHQAIKKYKPDVVHAFLYHAVQVCRLVKIMNGSFRLITSPRVNYRFLPAYARMADQLLKGLDTRVVCESRATADFLKKSMGYNERRVKVAFNGVDRQVYKADVEARERLRKEWGVRMGDVLIGSLGRLHHQKGYDVLMQAARRLAMEKIPFRLALGGAGPEKEALVRAGASLPDRVLMLGERTDIPAVLSAFDIYVQSSRYEGMSNALLEALSVGVPAVATSVDGTLDIAEDGKNMVLVKPNDPDDLAAGLKRVLKDYDLRKSLGLAGQATADKFSAAHAFSALKSCYRDLTS